MTCGAIQKESRPITMCQRMSHPTPMPARALATRSIHRARRRRVIVPAFYARSAAPPCPREQLVHAARVEDLPGPDPGAPRGRDAEVDVVELVEPVRVGVDGDGDATLRRLAGVRVLQVHALRRAVDL